MTDHLTKKERSKNMSRIRGKDTTPEKVVRKLLWGQGFRYRLHRKELPGNPDIVIGRLKTAIFVHGCYWHRHPGCKRGQSTPTTNRDWWVAKLARNAERDQEQQGQLRGLGWKVLVVWECETKKRRLHELRERLVAELNELDDAWLDEARIETQLTPWEESYEGMLAAEDVADYGPDEDPAES